LKFTAGFVAIVIATKLAASGKDKSQIRYSHQHCLPFLPITRHNKEENQLMEMRLTSVGDKNTI